MMPISSATGEAASGDDEQERPSMSRDAILSENINNPFYGATMIV